MNLKNKIRIRGWSRNIVQKLEEREPEISVKIEQSKIEFSFFLVQLGQQKERDQQASHQ